MISSQTMFLKPTMLPHRTPTLESKCFKIDLSRSVPPDIPSSDATVSMRLDWQPFHTLMRQEGGPEKEEIDEIALITIKRRIWTENTGEFYEGFWRNKKVCVSFRSLAKLDRRKLINERDCLALVQSKRVLELYATCLDFNRLTGNFITQTFNCTLRSFYDEFVPRKTTARFMTQLADGLSYVHTKNIVLRNICPENILVLNNGNLVFSHFAEAVKLNENGIYLDNKRIGFPEYAALETLQSNPETQMYHFSKSSDVFSLGSIFFEIWTSNSYTACPRHLIQIDPAEFYTGVLQQGRPFVRRNPGTNEMEFYITGKKEVENLLDRLESNLKLSCPDGLEDSFVDLFRQMLIFPWNTRILAHNIISSQAFRQLFQFFDTSDINDFEEPGHVQINSQEVIIKYTIEEKENIRAKMPSFYGFSKLFKRPFDTAVHVNSDMSSSRSDDNEHVFSRPSNYPPKKNTEKHFLSTTGKQFFHFNMRPLQSERDFGRPADLSESQIVQSGPQIKNVETQNQTDGCTTHNFTSSTSNTTQLEELANNSDDNLDLSGAMDYLNDLDFTSTELADAIQTNENSLSMDPIQNVSNNPLVAFHQLYNI